jgi:hypothetical protein
MIHMDRGMIGFAIDTDGAAIHMAYFLIPMDEFPTRPVHFTIRTDDFRIHTD